MTQKQSIYVALFAMGYPLLAKSIIGLAFTVATFLQSLNELALAIFCVFVSAVIIFSLNRFLVKLNPRHLGFSISIAGAIYYLFPIPFAVLSHSTTAIHLITVIIVPITIGLILNAKET